MYLGDIGKLCVHGSNVDVGPCSVPSVNHIYKSSVRMRIVLLFAVSSPMDSLAFFQRSLQVRKK